MIPIDTAGLGCTPRPAGEAAGRARANAAALRPDAAALHAAARVLADAGDCAAPVGDARLLPNAAYNDPDFWRFERHALFEREWLFVGHVSQVPNAGDHLAVRILDEPLLIVRDSDGGDGASGAGGVGGTRGTVGMGGTVGTVGTGATGAMGGTGGTGGTARGTAGVATPGTVRVLSAICQHRGHPLLDGLAAPADPGRCSNAKLLVCPYHSWSYKLDGRLHSAPAMGRTTPIAALREDVRLPEIRSEIVHGLIFVNFDADAPPLAPRLAKFDAAVRNFGMADLVATPTVTTGPHHWNWKIYQENSLEPYHTDFVHRDSHNPAPANLSAFYPFDAGDGQVITTTGFSADVGELFEPDGKVQLPAIEGLTPEEQGRLLFISVMPVLFLVLEAGSVLVTMALPLDADRTELKMFSLHPQAATEVDGYADIQAAQLQQLHAIVGEDLTTQEALHRGHRSRFSPPGRLSWLEATLPQMNQWLLERYRGALQALTDPPQPQPPQPPTADFLLEPHHDRVDP